MEWFVRAFLKASLAWLAAGVTLGVAMAVHPAWVAYRPAHLHMVLLGFVTMMIYGVAYHVIPRFAGHALASRRAAGVHWWLSNVGLAMMATGFVLRVHVGSAATPILGLGGVLAALGAYTFVVLIWRTVDGPKRLQAAARRSAQDVGRAGQKGLPIAS
jgi:cbb3-type cytochrome oxidase subunit 1